MGNGLLITTSNLSVPGFLRITDASVFSNFTVNLSFFWNDTTNYAFTEDFFSVYSGSQEIFNISLGPRGSYFVHENSISGQEIAFDPTMNELCNLSVSYNSASGTYFAFTDGTDNGLPVYYGSTSGNASGISVLVGGYVSTIFLRSITISGTTLYNSVDRSGDVVNYTSSPMQGFPTQLKTLKGVQYDRTLNTIVGVTTNDSLIGYNLVNATSFTLQNVSIGSSFQVLSASASDTMYFLAENLNSTIISEVNTTTLSVHRTLFSTGGMDPVAILPLNGTDLIFNSNGSVTDIHLNLGLYQTIILPLETDCFLLSAAVNGGSVNATWISNNSMETFMIFPGNASYSCLLQSNISNTVGEVETINLESHDYEVNSIIQYGLNSTIAMCSGGGIEPIALSADSGLVASVWSVADALVDNGSTYFSLNTGDLQQIRIPVAASEHFIDVGGATLISVSNNTTFLSVPTGENVTTGSGIEITVNTTYVLSGSDTVGTSVTSDSVYGENLTFANTTFSSSNGTFDISSSSISDGDYPALVKAQNLQGYSASLSCEIIIDHGMPVISTNIVNGTYLSQTPSINLNFTFWTGISRVYLTIGDTNTSLPTENSTELVDLSGISGSTPLEFVLVDQFDVVHAYRFNITVIPVQNGPFEINIVNGTYFNRNQVDIVWSSLNYIQEYYVNLSGSQDLQLTQQIADCNVTLANGAYSLNISAVLEDGAWVKIAARQFFVQSFGPGLILSGNVSGYYSFAGDSDNDSFTVAAQSNVSAMIRLSVFSSNGSILFQESGENMVEFSSANHSVIFTSAGSYVLRINATGDSGISDEVKYLLNVNNSIPKLPFSQNAVYTNQSSIALSPAVSKHCDYSSSLFKSGSLVYSGADSAQLILSAGAGNYTEEMTVVSAWGNWVSQNLSIIYETSVPEISLNASYNGSEYLWYTISDSVPMESMVVKYQQKSTVLSYPTENGSLKLDLNRNSVFNISVIAKDLCGNVGYSNLTLDFHELVNITGYSITVYPLLGFAIAVLHLQGQNTENASIDWVYQGRTYSSNTLILPFIGFGKHNFTAEIHYGNRTVSVSSEAFFTGWYPLIVVVLAGLAFVAFRRLRESTDSDEIRDLIITMSGAPLKAIFKEARKAKLNRKQVDSVISEMRKIGEANVESDPDGVLYLFFKEKE